MEIKKIETKQELQTAINNGAQIINFFAEWCGPCKMFASTLESIANKGYSVVKINIDKAHDLSNEWKVRSIPTTFVLQNGKTTKQFVGLVKEEELVNEMISKS